MANLNRLSWTAAMLLVACSGKLAGAAEPPSDLCSRLPPAVVSKEFGDTFGSPKKTVAPRPFPNIIKEPIARTSLTAAVCCSECTLIHHQRPPRISSRD